MIAARLQLLVGDDGKGLEAPLSSLSHLELTEATAALLNQARAKGWIIDLPPSADAWTTFRVSVEELS